MAAGFRDRVRLSEEEKVVLSLVEFYARAPFSEIASSCGLKESSVRYLVKRLIDRGVITGRLPYLNLYLLGFTNYALYFTMNPWSDQDRKEFSRFLSETVQVTWFMEMGGEFQYALTFSGRHVQDLAVLRERISDKFSHIIAGLTVSTRVALWTFPRKYLAAQELPTVPEWLQGGVCEPTLDPIDTRVLTALSHDRFDSLRVLAKRAGLPPSTFDRRVRALQDTGVIQGFHYLINAHAIGFEDFRLLVHARGVTRDLTDRLFSFSRSHLNIRKFIHCICEWDYEFEVSVPSTRELQKVVEVMYERFGHEIRRIRVVPLFVDVSGPVYSNGIVCPVSAWSDQDEQGPNPQHHI